jgi:hypothetical protein
MALVQALLACVFTLARRGWRESARATAPRAGEDKPRPEDGPARRKPSAAVALTCLTFAAVETGIESGAGIWGYVFLTAGRGLPAGIAGVAVCSGGPGAVACRPANSHRRPCAHRSAKAPRAAAHPPVARTSFDPVKALAGGFVAHAAGLRAPYIVAGILCAVSMLAALPFLLSADPEASVGRPQRPIAG